jgi:signal transduction histidine kinase
MSMNTAKLAQVELETPSNPGHEVLARASRLAPDWLRSENGQRALLNILEDFAAEKSSLESGQRAMLNILEDFDNEQARMEGAQQAVLNILEDFSDEKGRLEGTQRAVLNILEDFETEKYKVELINQRLEKQMEERERVQQEMQSVNAALFAANKELEAFSYSVSHDLRAPLRAIDGFSHALLEDCADKLEDEDKSHLNRIRAATQRMGVLIDDLLNLARITRTEMHIQSLDLSAIVRTITTDLQKAQPERRIEFRIEDGLEAMADPGLIRIVLVNLLSNAWKFTSKRPSAVIAFGKESLNGSPAYFVRDDGAGFDPAHTNRLFGAFQRLHAASEFPGTGVGLATAQRIVHRYGGRIWAESALGQGATFYFTLAETPS